MPAGCGDEEWLAKIDTEVVPELEAFAPEVLMVSAGFDAHARDPIGGQHLSAEAFREMTKRVQHLADGRIISMLEGGYDLDGLRESTAAHIAALADIATD